MEIVESIKMIQNDYIVDKQYWCMLFGIDVFGFDLPLWAIFLIGIIVVVIVWKLAKFAIKILLILLFFLIILMLLDSMGAFEGIKNLVSVII